MPSRNPWRHTRNKVGYRADIGIRVKSALEADAFRYLKALKRMRKIADFSYEPTVLHFEHKGRRVGYKPDFLIRHLDGREEWLETKGKLDPKSRMKIRLARAAGHKVVLVRRDKLERLRERDGVSDSHWEYRRDRRG